MNSKQYEKTEIFFTHSSPADKKFYPELRIPASEGDLGGGVG